MKTVYITIVALILLSTAPYIYAGPSNGTYELKQYGFGNGGTDGSNNGTNSMYGFVGELENGTQSNGTYNLGDGLVYTIQAHVPPAPTFTNPNSNYDRLKLVINNGNNPSDAEFAIAISTDNFVTTRYVQNDGTVGNVLGNEDWQTYTSWGGASGVEITGLQNNTTYKVKLKARQGDFTETGYGPEASVATVDPSLTFGISSNTLTFNNLNSGNSYTDSTQSTTLTTSTNAYNGYVVYARITADLTSGGNTISNYTSPNSAPTSWSGNGFGYTTSDSNLIGGTADRFTSGGPKYAGFTTTAPGDPVADHAGPITTPISGETFDINYRITTASTQPAGIYKTFILYVVVPSF